MNASFETPLSPRQERAIIEILSTPSLEEARRRVRASKCAFYGWLKDATFQAELKRRRAAVVSDAVERLQAGMANAVTKLLSLMGSGREQTQLRSALTIIEQGLKTKELEELEARLSALESVVLNRRGGR